MWEMPRDAMPDPRPDRPGSSTLLLRRRRGRGLHGRRDRNPGHREVLEERGVEVLRDLAGLPAALLEHGGERLRRLEERVGVPAAAEDLAVHVRRLLGADEGDD